MFILIVGAGRIGSTVAESFVSQGHDIAVVDSDPERVAEVQRRLDLRGVAGNAFDPKTLAEAGAQDADMVLAVTANDETNLAVCLMASRIFNIPARIARVRGRTLRAYPRVLAEEGFQVSSTIWPEESITNSIVRLIEFPETLQIIDLADGRIILACVRAVAGSPMVGRPINQLASHLPSIPAQVVSVFRRNRWVDVSLETVIESGDEVVVLAPGREMRKVIGEFRSQEKPVKTILLAGDTDLALQLAERLLRPESRRGYTIKILVKDRGEGARRALAIPKGALFVEGSMTDEETLSDLEIETCDYYVALSLKDENNIMGSLLAKKLGAKRTIALINSQSYIQLMQGTSIDVTVSSAEASLGDLMKHIRRGDVVASHRMRRGIAEVLEVVAHGSRSNSKVVGRRVSQIRLPEGVRIAAVAHGSSAGGVEMADAETVIEPEDRVVVFVANKKLISKVEELFSVDVGFF
ncbi:MAG: Trk system potassium transporter TrkA [Duodenibacillus sp.]|nr:Trk system potassium transporter TrkA [Duodenibacillus sp.]